MELTQVNENLQKRFDAIVKECGSSLSAENLIGQPYITYSYRFNGPMYEDVLEEFFKEVEKECNKTGLLSVRLKPYIIEDGKLNLFPAYQLRARFVAYYGAIPDFDW